MLFDSATKYSAPVERILGVEGGGTKTAWVLLSRDDDGATRLLERGKLPAANFRLTSPERLSAMFARLPREAERVGVYLAGCVTETDRQNLAKLCATVWPAAKIITGGDRASGMAAALERSDGIVVNAGTGSSVTGRRGENIEYAGGWGHILGDAGGGYYLSLQALRAVLREYDLHRGAAEFAADVLRALSLNNFDELVRWAQTADKMQIAMLAPVVFHAAERGDETVQRILESGARVLAEYTVAVARRLEMDSPPIVLLGGLFECCAVYVSAFGREIAPSLPRASVRVTAHPPEFGAAWLAMGTPEAWPAFAPLTAASSSTSSEMAITEQRNPRSSLLDELSTQELVKLFVEEERLVQDALRACVEELSRAINLIATSLRNGGRLFYVGAGTSGRLGVLDASEIPPTFGVSEDLVQGIIAGGVTALYRSAEGAEDQAADGALALAERGVRAGDVVCGIAASGRTPFVLGALTEAKAIGARTIFLTCNPARPRLENACDVEIDLPTGPELVTGSTRLKAGTATKVALNILTTGAMVALGKVRGNLMVDLAPTNDKLRDRAARIIAELAPCSYEEARQRLAATGGSVRLALEGNARRVTA